MALIEQLRNYLEGVEWNGTGEGAARKERLEAADHDPRSLKGD